MPPGSTTLVVVESPAKAKTIQGLLPPHYLVESSMGHVRDLLSTKTCASLAGAASLRGSDSSHAPAHARAPSQ